MNLGISLLDNKIGSTVGYILLSVDSIIKRCRVPVLNLGMLIKQEIQW